MGVRLLAATGVLLLLAGVSLSIRGYEPFVATDLVAPGTELDTFGERGSIILRYEHDTEIFYAVTLRNDGPLGVTVTRFSLAREPRRLLEPVAFRFFPDEHAIIGDVMPATVPFAPFALGPSEERTVVVQARFDNCEYYTERALDVLETLHVHFRVLGVPRHERVALPHQLIVRSPTILRCPDRTTDRSENRRTDPTP